MLHSNANNPINWELAVDIATAQQVNQQHRDMPRNIEASSDSLALQQVRQAQYADAVADVRRALEKVLGLQERAIELAFVEAPNDALDRELDLLGL